MFRIVEAAAPRGFAWLSVVVVLCQTAFQFAMVPLAATSFGGRFVHWWGWVFILGSLGDLQLSILPVVEVIMWAVVFTPAHWFVWRDRATGVEDVVTALPPRAATAASTDSRSAYRGDGA